jgi:hypothetical protein
VARKGVPAPVEEKQDATPGGGDRSAVPWPLD